MRSPAPSNPSRLSLGWRFGWIALHDPLNVAGAIRNGLHAWGNRFMGPNTLVQKSLKRILSETPDSWYDEVTRKLEVSCGNIRSTLRAFVNAHRPVVLVQCQIGILKLVCYSRIVLHFPHGGNVPPPRSGHQAFPRVPVRRRVLQW